MMKKCCMCDRIIEREDAPVLAMGAAGNPRLLCDECEKLLDTATLGEDYDEIKNAISKISDIMSNGNPDGVTYAIISELVVNSSNRAKSIKDGSYDFALDEETVEEGFDEIPEELLESEEDIEKDKADEALMKKFDKFYNIALIVAGVAFVGFLAWKIISTFFLK